MGKEAKTTEVEKRKKAEVVEVNFVRVETTELRKYPMHLLQSRGSDAKEIVIRDTNSGGKEVIKWHVRFTSVEGAPGTLAYRIDRLVIDRCIEKQGQVPKVLRLGTLNEICDALGIDRTGPNTKNIQQALMQLYGTQIKSEGKTTTWFGRFQWISFTGDKGADGLRGDAVYIGLSDPYQAILSRAGRRPLDYDYLKDLSPAASRLYEILSVRMFAALSKNSRTPKAWLPYSEFTELSALTRYDVYKLMAKQMRRINEPHIQSGYIESVSFDARIDKFGHPDWMMIYIPGDKARREFKAATKRGVEVKPHAEIIDITEARSEPIQASLPLPATKPLTDAQALAQRLVKAGVWITKAQALIELYPEAAEVWADVYESGFLEKKNDPAAYLVKAISENAQPPKRYHDRKKALERLVQDEGRRKTKRDWEREEIAALHEYIDGLSIEEAEQFERSVIESLSVTEQKILESLNAGKARSQVLEDFRLKYWRAMTAKSPL